MGGSAGAQLGGQRQQPQPRGAHHPQPQSQMPWGDPPFAGIPGQLDNPGQNPFLTGGMPAQQAAPQSANPFMGQPAQRPTSSASSNLKSPLYQQLMGQAQAAQGGTYRQGFSPTQQGLLESLGGPTMPTVAPAPATTPGPSNQLGAQAIERNRQQLAARQAAPPQAPEAPTPFNDISVMTALGPMAWQNAAARGYMSPDQLADMMVKEGADRQQAMNAIMPIYQPRIGVNPTPGTTRRVTWFPQE